MDINETTLGNTVRQYYDKISTDPSPGVAAQTEKIRKQVREFLAQNNLPIDEELITTVTILSQVGYSMKNVISSEVIIHRLPINNDIYEFSISNGGHSRTYDLVCVRSIKNYTHEVLFMFWLGVLKDGLINGEPVDYV